MKAFEYIEDHLKEKVSLEEIASYSGYSVHHLHKIFSAGFGDSLRGYIRKRRMTEAAYEIVNSKKSILSIAIDYCYESQEAFSRAFLKAYNLTPGEFRNKKLFYSIRNKIDVDYISFEFNRRKNGMTPKIIYKDDIYIIGKKVTIKGLNNYYKEIPIFWQKWCLELYSENISGDIDKSQINGICVSINENTLEYIIGHEVKSNNEVAEGYELFKIKSAKYAVFTVTGPFTESVQKTWDYIWGTWLLDSDINHSGMPEIENYYYINGINYTDIYVPIE